jgi:hypothetical protein
VAAGNVSNSEGHGKHRQAERQSDARESDAERGKASSQHSRTATAEDQPESSKEFCDGTFANSHKISFMVKGIEFSIVGRGLS